MFHVGQKVVALASADEWQVYGGEVAPYKGQILTIRSFCEGSKGQIGLRFEEIQNPRKCHMTRWSIRKVECGFAADKFRPLRKTSIEIFEAMLHPFPVNSFPMVG
jgi:hypothetical protein